MSISTSYLSNLYSSYSLLINSSSNSSSSSSSSSSLLTKLMGTSSSSSSLDMTEIASRYTYFKNNYKEIKASLTESDTDDTTTESSSSTTNSTSTTKSYIQTKLYAGDLKDSISELSSESLYVENSDGEIETNKILSSVKSFIDSYNSLKEISADSTNETVVKQAYYMVNTTTAFKSNLNSIGITVKSDNTLELNEETFNASDMSNVKALFSGSSSYGQQVSKRAIEIKSAPISGYLTYSNITSSSDSSSILESYLSNLNTTSILDYFV